MRACVSVRVCVRARFFVVNRKEKGFCRLSTTVSYVTFTCVSVWSTFACGIFSARGASRPGKISDPSTERDFRSEKNTHTHRSRDVLFYVTCTAVIINLFSMKLSSLSSARFGSAGRLDGRGLWCWQIGNCRFYCRFIIISMSVRADVSRGGSEQVDLDVRRKNLTRNWYRFSSIRDWIEQRKYSRNSIWFINVFDESNREAFN